MTDRRRLAAAVPLGILLALHAAFLAASNLIPLRPMTAATLILSGAITLLLADDRDPPRVAWLTPVFALPATVCSVLALVLRAELLLSVAVASMLTLWIVQLSRLLGRRRDRAGELLHQLTRRSVGQ
ncbi:hypothetical protein [Kribbella sp. HUAS MG21]|uniref:hypothetical protein n=1 Tax=Kribbella sp. HUAS MG21 TaxID=3160966 RepID=UPI003305F849